MVRFRGWRPLRAIQGMMEKAPTTLEPGYRLDRYELLCPIASGGMATVWLARLRGKRGFEKLFAIKTIKTELIHDVRFQEMFLDEARIASGIQHPNVAQILDLGEQDDVLYIVMEWVDGESLARIRRLAAKRGATLPLGIALRVIADACGGLHAAHKLHDQSGKSLGIVHRDVSPQNILLSGAGSVKVIDFGIAKATNRGAGDTGGGVIKGKIHYMAPEQARGHAIDRRVDIWSIGVCLYELTAGKLPFDGDSDVDVVRRLLTDEPAPRPDESIPAPVADIITCSLSRDPGTRFSTAAAMQRAIETVIDKLGLPATNEDIAEFLHAHFSDLAERRSAMVTGAIQAAQAREAGGASIARVGAAGANDDVGFAPTILSPPKPEASKPRNAPSPPKEDSKLTLGSAALEMEEVAGLPKRRGWMWAVILVALGAAGTYGVRVRGIERIRAFLAPSRPQTPEMTTAPVLSTHAALAPSPPVASVSAPVASSSAAPPQAPSSSKENASTRAPRASPTAARPGAPGGASPRVSNPATTAPVDTPPAVEVQPAPAPTPSKAPDEDNPYNN
jgi:eukaryotic-like serine/threonine-protein kinase